MARIVLIDDDSTAIDTLGNILRLAHHDFASARTGEEGIERAIQFEPDVAFVDIQLPDISGIEVARRLSTDNPTIACVVMTGYPAFEYARDALRAGVCDWLDKPVFAEDVLSAIRRALTGRDRRHVSQLTLHPTEPHALLRLAEVAVRFIASPQDKPTLRLLGREVGHAPGSLRNWCRTAGVEPRSFRDFVRALRASWRLERENPAKDANLLTIVDGRTLKKFRIRSGGTESALPATVSTFLERQHLVRDPSFVSAVRQALGAATLPVRSAKVVDPAGRPPPTVHDSQT